MFHCVVFIFSRSRCEQCKRLWSLMSMNLSKTHDSALLKFSIVFSLISPTVYFLADVYKLPFLTYFPATDEIYFGWKAFNEESGPAMYWYGWLLTSLFISAFSSSFLIYVLPLSTKKLVFLSNFSWIAIILLIPFLIQSLKFYWR